MTAIRRTKVRRGEAGTQYMAMIVGAILLLAIGFVLGRNLGGGTPIQVDPGTDSAQTEEQSSTPEIAEVPETEPDEEDSQFDPATPGVMVRDVPYEFDPPELDFGVVQPDADMTGSMQLRNISGAPLKITAMKSDCKCTTIQDLTGTILQPGESVEVTAVMEGRPGQGSKNSEIRFVFEGYGLATFKIKSRVSRAVALEPTTLTAQGGTSGVVTLTASDARPFNILASNGEPPVYTDGFDPTRDEPRSEYKIGWDLLRWDQATCLDAEGNHMPDYWVIETDHPGAPILDLRVRQVPCTLPEPLNGRMWVLSLPRANLGVLATGQVVEFTVYLKWIKDSTPNDNISSVVSESEQFDAELLEETREGDRITYRVRIIPAAEHRGLINGKLRFYSRQRSDSQSMTILARVAAES